MNGTCRVDKIPTSINKVSSVNSCEVDQVPTASQLSEEPSNKKPIKEKAPIKTGVIDIDLPCDHECVKNYDGSSGAMESDGLLLLFMSLHKRYRNKIFYQRVVTDDDTKLKKYMTYPAYAPAGWVNHGGCLPSYLIEPS